MENKKTTVNGRMDEETAVKHIKKAIKAKNPWIKEAKEDFEFALGKQWTEEAAKKHRDAGVNPLTINKIASKTYLLSGIQRQNRADPKAFPEGSEDNVKADIATRLLKNAVKRNNGEYKQSEQFEDGITCGEGWLEPVVDYTYNMVNGDLKYVKLNPFNVFKDPDSIEYDLSDALYVFKITPKLPIEKVLKLFPDKKEKDFEGVGGRFNMEKGGKVLTDAGDYDPNIHGTGESVDDYMEKGYDVIEFEYRAYKKVYVVIDKMQGTAIEVEDKVKAEAYVEKVNGDAREENGLDEDDDSQDLAMIIPRTIEEIRIKSFVGNTEVEDVISPFYPKWRSFRLFQFLAHYTTTPIDDREYMTQGIVRMLKDPQREVNKRRTQVLRHLNATANSGWLSKVGAWVDKKLVKMFGASPGIILEWKGGDKPERITPAPLSQGHEFMSQESSEDIKHISGINDDLLAINDSKSQSGRAIHLRQQQGMVMIQRIIDNFSRTQKTVAKFVLSQLGEIYSVETAVRVCGEAFLKENFSIPIVEQSDIDGQPRAVLGPDGEVQTEINMESVLETFTTVLDDAEMSHYDISVGEGANTQTVKFANYLLLMELTEKGVQIPHDILIDESMLDTGSKAKIKQAINAAQQAASV